MNEAFGEIHMAALHDEIQSRLAELEQHSLTKGWPRFGGSTGPSTALTIRRN
jgi:hypothetical protein